MKTFVAIALAASVATTAARSGAENEGPTAPPSSPDVLDPSRFPKDADNTGTNVRDRSGETLTPLDQGNGEADLTLTQSIRKAIVADDDLSMNAKNVKVITRDGVVTLRGPVSSQAERARVELIARREAGTARVDNQLEVVADDDRQ